MGITSGTVGVVFAATLIGCGVHGSTGSKAVFSGRFSGPEGGFTIFDSSSSRTVSCIIAPQVRQIDRVGASSRLQTGQFIGFPKPNSLDYLGVTGD